MRLARTLLVLLVLLSGCTALDNGPDPSSVPAPVKVTLSGEIRYWGDNKGTEGDPAVGEVAVTIRFPDETVTTTNAEDGKFSIDLDEMPSKVEGISASTNMAGWVVVKTTVHKTQTSINLIVFVTPGVQAGPARIG